MHYKVKYHIKNGSRNGDIVMEGAPHSQHGPAVKKDIRRAKKVS